MTTRREDQDGRLAVVAGSSGLVGSALVDALDRRGWRVRRLLRPSSGRAGRDDATWDPANALLDVAALDGADLVVNLAGAGLGDKRWTEAYKGTALLSRTSSTSLLATTLARALEAGRTAPGVRYLQGSAVGWYGDRGEEVLTEDSPAGRGFTADLSAAWEAAAAPAVKAGVPTAFLRTGIVLAPRGGALGRMLPLLRAGLGGPLGGGQQWWPWITLEDHVRAQLHLAGSARVGPINLAAPGEARQREVLAALAHELRRPFGLPVPGLALRAVLGEFAADVLASQRMRPETLVADGFEFAHPDVASAARWLVGPGGSRTS
ncbi:TIGR01777 family oxidoreductase [Georgenia sp. Z1491]|uniref:TIGR01777 family oxidoreductase n=1 Tax=Georgenia sp. Z1491 TaxID=3416707 RepID=UPI003CF5DAEC